MKTVQFHRNKQELRNQLLSFFSNGQTKTKSQQKKQSISKEKVQKRSKSKSRQQKQLISNNMIISQVQQTIQAPRIKLKLKKKTQNQVNKILSVTQQNYPLQYISSKVSENIKKAIQKQLLCSFYKDKNKQVDNRKTALREQDDQQNDQSQTLNKYNEQRNSENNLTKDRQQRCAKILQERNSRMINSFQQENVRQQANKLSQEFKKSIRFIPEDQVYIPKSFITFTVKRKQYQNGNKISESKQNKKIKSVSSQKDLITKDIYKQKVERVRTQVQGYKQKNRSLSSMPYYSKNSQQIEKKMAFYNRYSNQAVKSTSSLKRQTSRKQIKQSSLKTIKSVNNIIEVQEKRINQRQIKVVEQEHQRIKQKNLIQESKKSQLVALRKSIQNNNKQIKTQISKEKSFEKQKEFHAKNSRQRKPQQNTRNFPIVKMTESLYQDKNWLLTSQQQQEPSLSLTSSLNYSTPFGSVQQSHSKQSLTINKLSTISKIPEQGSQLSQSLTKYEQVPLKFTEVKVDKKGNDDILTTSLTKFKEYQQKKEKILKQKESLKNIKTVNLDKLKSQAQIDKQKQGQNQQFNDFDEIFLQSNKANIDKLKLEQKQKESIKQSKQKPPKQKNNKVKQRQFFEKEKMNQQPESKFKNQPSIKEQKSEQQQKSESIRKEFEQKESIIISQHKVEEQKNEDEVPPQLQMNESSIQQSLSDFTPEPSLADIKINGEMFLEKQKLVSNQKDSQQEQLLKNESQGKILKQKNNEQKQVLSQLLPQFQKQQKNQISLDQLQDYRFQDDQNIIDSQQKNHLYFEDFPEWKYNDNRDKIPLSIIQKMKEKKEIKVIHLDMKQSNLPQSKKKQESTMEKNSEKIKILESKIQQPKTTIQIKKESVQQNQQLTNSLRPKSTVSNKVRLIQNIQLSSSSSSQSQQIQQNNLANKRQVEVTNVTKGKQTSQKEDQVIQNRYYSSSDQQENQSNEVKSSITKDKTTTKQQTKLTLKKQNSMKKTFSNNIGQSNNKNVEKNELQRSKQKVIPLGIKINKPKDLFPVLQDSQEWNYGSQSVGQIDNNISKQNSYKMQNKVVRKEKNIKIEDNTKEKQFKRKDQQLDLLEKQFSQPTNKIKKAQQQTKPKQVNFIKKQSAQSKSLSDFTESESKSKSNMDQSMSDFSHDQSMIELDKSKPQKQISTNNKKKEELQKNDLILQKKNNQVENSTIKDSFKPSKNFIQLNQIHKQREIVHDLKNHVELILKRISSENSISHDQDHSFLSQQPSIKPVSMSSSGSLVSKQSFVESYEQNNVKESIVRSKNQKENISKNGNDEQSKQKSNKFKKYEKESVNSKIIETNPLFDFSDKSLSENEKQRKISSVKKYSQNDQSKILSKKSSNEQSQNSQTSIQATKKQDILKQFDSIARISQKDFSKNKTYYLKHKDKQRQSSFDLPILRPNGKKQHVQIKKSVNTMMNQSFDKNLSYQKRKEMKQSSQGSSGQVINHKQIEIVPQSLYVTNARNASSINHSKNSQNYLKQSYKIKRGLSVSKKISSNSNEQQKKLSEYEKNSNSGSFINKSQSQLNQSSNAVKQKGSQNQFLWNFIMKK